MTEDKFLLEQLQNWPEQGLKLAVAEYGGLVKRVVLTVLPGADSRDVEECVADVFLKLYRSAGRFQPEAGSLKNYLCGIARHTAIDRGRRLRRLHTVTLDAAELGLSPDIADGLLRQETARLVQQAVDELPQPDREIFIRRYYYSQRVAEIAQALGLDEKAVENRLYRGRQKLKSKLSEKGVSA